MDTKEAIEFLEIEIKCLEKEIEICNPNDDIDIQDMDTFQIIEANKNIIIKYNQVIILLQQGKKYKELFKGMRKSIRIDDSLIHILREGKKYKIIMEELKKEYGNGILENDYGIGVQLFNLIEILEQKYFPKETNQEYKEGEE